MDASGGESSAGFKKCPSCGHPWKTRDALLEDPNIELAGYQVNFDHLELGLFLFNHLSCRTTLAIPAGDMTGLYDGPIFEERKTGSTECPRYCLYVEELGRCPAKCACAYVREVLQIVAHWPKRT
jgi:hypothetical protein